MDIIALFIPFLFTQLKIVRSTFPDSPIPHLVKHKEVILEALQTYDKCYFKLRLFTGALHCRVMQCDMDTSLILLEAVTDYLPF